MTDIELPQRGAEAYLVVIGCAIGALWVLTCLCSCLCFCWKHCLRCRRNLHSRFDGKWSVVTGATDGLGKGFALELARSGYNVMLVSRSQEKLDAVAIEIKAQYPGVETETVACSFGGANNNELIDKAAQAMSQRDVAILVNNLGVNIPTHLSQDLGTPDKPTWEDVERVMDINCKVATKLSIVASKQMIARGARGGIIIVGSLGGVGMGVPSSAVYGGTKAYTSVFSMGLRAEVEKQGITVTSIMPGPVLTPLLTGMMKSPPPGTITPAKAAQNSLTQLSWGELEAAPSWKHQLMMAMVKMTPRTASARAMNLKLAMDSTK